MTSTRSLDELDDALRDALEALDHLGEGEPDEIGIDHVELDGLERNDSLAELVEHWTVSEEWDRLERPDFSTRELLGRILSVKRATARALDAQRRPDFDWSRFTLPRIAERPFRIRLDRRNAPRVYAASTLVDGVAIAAAARFPGG